MAENKVNLNSLGKAEYPERKIAHTLHENHLRVAADLIATGSIEFSSGSPEQINAVAELLPRGMPVFVPVLPGQTLQSRLDLIGHLHQSGLDPVPHLAARRIPSRATIEDFLHEARRISGLHRVLLIGGDTADPAGPYADAAALLRDGLLAQAGITEVGFAGYPEGHPKIGAEIMRAALLEKLQLAEQTGLAAHIITQFSFVPQRIIDYCSTLARLVPEVPVYVGLAGPASLRKLVHFARYCGVSASLSAVSTLGLKVAQLVNHVRADEQLALLASYLESQTHGIDNVTGVHLFSFGGFRETAEWMHNHLNKGDGAN